MGKYSKLGQLFMELGKEIYKCAEYAISDGKEKLGGWANSEINNYQLQMQNDEMNRQFIEESLRFTTEEAMKIVTPFDMGGYVQGEGFNPSDTMAAEASHFHMNSFDNGCGGMF